MIFYALVFFTDRNKVFSKPKWMLPNELAQKSILVKKDIQVSHLIF